tara:strand:+ start:3856 stop:5001 length:1146 start_codon:yes stop_codon:yes gene_type:complete
MKYLFILFLCFFINGCIPFNDTPKPSGVYSIGTRSLEIIDFNRKEWFTKNDKNDLRKIMVQIWYPTKDLKGERDPYIDYGNIRIKALSEQFDYSTVLFRNLINVKTNSIKNAAPLDNINQFPLIIFSHGLGGMRVQNTILVEELVSNGYVVVAIEHAYDANVSVFSDSTIADYRSGISYEGRNFIQLTPDQFWDLRLPQLKTRAGDVYFVINQIEKGMLFKDILPMVDLNKIGIFGHSFGGATSIYSSYFDSRIDACINLDGWIVVIPDDIVENGINQNFMYIGQEKWDEELNYKKLDNLIKANKSSEKIIIPLTTHYDFSDTPHMSSAAKLLNISGKIKNKDLKNILNYLVVSFFNKNLKNQDIDYLNLVNKFGVDLNID